MLAKELEILKGREQFDSLVAAVVQAAVDGVAIDQVEKEIWSQVLNMGRTFLSVYLAQQGPGDLGETLEHEGRTLKRLEQLHHRRYVSVFGPLQIPRTVYGTRETQKHEMVPLDARLNLPEGEFFHLLQDWDQAFCVQNSYAKSGETVRSILGIGQSVRSLEHMSRSMARDVAAFREFQAPPDPQEEGPILVVTADGKGVPMCRQPDQAAPQGRLNKGEKANKKRSACVGAVYTIEPFFRTARDVVDEVMRKIKAEDRPAPCHKQVRAELTRMIDGEEVNGKEITFTWFEDQIKARNPGGEKEMVCLMDGERALRERWKKHLPGVTYILDLYHVMERLWVAAYCFFQEGSEKARLFVTQKLEGILEGKAGRVIGGMKQMATKRKLNRWRRKRLLGALRYLRNNLAFMKYDEYLKKGYPIGSGVVEGTCRHLVKDRMELTGMRWTTEGAQAILDLRAIYINRDWERFQEYRIEAESRRLYPFKENIELKWKAAA